jgi:hypothetical protein
VVIRISCAILASSLESGAILRVARTGVHDFAVFASRGASGGMRIASLAGGERHPVEERLMATQPTIARIWRGRTRRAVANAYEAYLKAEGIPPLEKTALGVQLFREDRDTEIWFTTISYWPDLESMTAFTKGEPTKVHHLDHDPEFLIELPERIEIHRVVLDRQGLR